MTRGLAAQAPRPNGLAPLSTDGARPSARSSTDAARAARPARRRRPARIPLERTSEDRLLHGLAADGSLRHVADVPQGRACGLRCPACGGDLIARRGKILQPHLAHATHTSCVDEHAADVGMRAAGAALLEIWIPQMALPDHLLAHAVSDGFRTWRIHPAAARIAPEIRDSPAVRRLSPAERARAAILYGLTPPEPIEPPIVHPLVGRPVPRGALMGEPDAVWQARLLGAIVRAEAPVGYHHFESLLRPPAEACGRRRPAFAKVIREVRLRHPTDALKAWLQEGVRAGLLQQHPGWRYSIGPVFSAHDRIAFAARAQE